MDKQLSCQGRRLRPSSPLPLRSTPGPCLRLGLQFCNCDSLGFFFLSFYFFFFLRHNYISVTFGGMGAGLTTRTRGARLGKCLIGKGLGAGKAPEHHQKSYRSPTEVLQKYTRAQKENGLE